MMPDEPTDEERQEELPEDNGTPFQPADPSRDDTRPPDDSGQPTVPADDTHPGTDTDADPMELYDQGITNVDEPNAGNAVTGFHNPDNDQVTDEEE